MEMNNPIENIGRPIVNANIGVTNVLESDDIYSVMLNTFNDIVRVLSDHCGPYGKFAMITSATNRLAEPVFTKDGIGIVRAMEYMSVMQEYVRNTLVYMGSRIETAAGDGTTSSMIICAKGMHELLRNLLSSEYAYSYTDLEREYKKYAEDVERILRENCYTIDKLLEGIEREADRKKIIYRAAYAQAYTSSHCNKDLAHAVATLFAETPKEAWKYLYIEKAKYESDKQYEVVVDESQYTCENVRIFPGNSLTDNMGTARYSKDYTNITLCGVPPCVDDTFVDGHDVFECIAEAITRPNKEFEDVFICSKDIDGNTLNQLNILFSKHPNTKTVMFLVDTTDPRLNDIVCMKVLRNDFQMKSSFSGDYKFEGAELKITDGLYENPTDSKLNPMIGDKNYPAINEMLSNIDKVITQIKSQTANRTLNEQINNLQKLRLKLLVSKRTYFRIGGAAYDVAAATDVVLDAILAVKHSLTNGFGLGGNKALYVANEKHWFTYNYENQIIKDLHLKFIQAIHAGIIEVFESALKWVKEECRPSFEAFKSQDIFGIEYIPEDKRCTKIEDLTKNLDSDEFVVPIVQPISADIEIVNRFGELALKFVKTERIITPGGLVTNKKIDTI